MIVASLSAGTRKEVEALEAAGTMVNTELFKCDRGTRKFAIGDRCELHVLATWPQFALAFSQTKTTCCRARRFRLLVRSEIPHDAVVSFRYLRFFCCVNRHLH